MSIRFDRRAAQVFAAAATLTMLGRLASAGDARVLADEGRVLTVGAWGLLTADDGELVRYADTLTLGWELRNEEGILLSQGLVPGSESLGVDASPALSRDPVTGDILLTWSRQAAPGAAREIALQHFNAALGDWTPGTLQTLVADSDDQLDPVVVHDSAGTAWIAWIDGLNTRTVRFAGVLADGRVLGQSALSEGISTLNGPPSLGIDAIGRLFVAYAGTPVSGGDVTLHVLTPNPIGGGVTHVPNPFIELGLRGTVPVPTIGRATPPSGTAPVPSRVNLTVLGGVPVAWWTEVATVDGVVMTRFRYAAEGDTGWSGSALRSLDLSSGLVASVPEALALVEARLRRVIDQSPGAGRPVAPPSQVGGFGRIQRR